MCGKIHGLSYLPISKSTVLNQISSLDDLKVPAYPTLLALLSLHGIKRFDSHFGIRRERFTNKTI
jgi:hypothetical protein